jgi:LmbE family N-acetylglucosaminyl deacetylase
MSSKVLIVSVHPDDETLGCGGTALLHKFRGDDVYCLHVTDGNEKQKALIQPLKEKYRFSSISLRFPEIVLEDISLSKLIPSISEVMKEIKPEIVYLPNRSDPHSDHRRVFDACQSCIKNFRYPFLRKVMMMEVISETDFAPPLIENAFIPNVFVDISEFMDKKIEVLQLFSSELLEYPNTRSIDTMRAYNRYRGSQINTAYAECFMLLKETII